MGFEDLELPWAGDFEVSAQGDLATSTGIALLKQRIIRRILTNKKELLFEPLYGVGLPLYVHQGISSSIFNEVKARIIQEVLKEETVVRDPMPEIHFDSTFEGITVFIRVWTTDSTQVALGFEVSR